MKNPFQVITRKRVGRGLGGAIVIGAVTISIAIFQQVAKHPETEDAEVYANLIEVAPQVSGPITKIYVRDNQLVKRGDLLFEIDSQPFDYAVERAVSEQRALEGQIADMRRTISARKSAVDAAEANLSGSHANAKGASSSVEGAGADLNDNRAALARAKADYAYASNNLQRLEPLLTKQFVTVDVVDQARTLQATRLEGVRQAEAALAKSEARLKTELSREAEAHALVNQNAAQLAESKRGIPLLEPLEAQRGARMANIRSAQYDLANCKVYAPFDGRVTRLGISEGFYAHAGSPVFTLIDTRTWWVIASFRETQLAAIKPGMSAEVYLMSDSRRRFRGIVDSIGFGVEPDESLDATTSPKPLPAIQRTLNWVHLATRFPVRVRVDSPPPELFRIGTSAVVVVRDANGGAATH